MVEITLWINGQEQTLDVDPRESLLETLRDRLGVTSPKKGCGVGECGACAVLVDGKAVNSCLYLSVWAHGSRVRTVEGMAAGGRLSALQKAYVEEGAVQCGFCIPGFLVSAQEMKETGRTYSREEVRWGLSGHLCRCTGYQKIVDATCRGLAEPEDGPAE